MACVCVCASARACERVCGRACVRLDIFDGVRAPTSRVILPERVCASIIACVSISAYVNK